MCEQIANLIINNVKLAAEFYAKKDSSFLQHSRKCYGIVICYDAELEFCLSERKIKADKNKIVVLPEKSAYVWSCKKEGKYSVIEFDANSECEEIIGIDIKDINSYYAQFKELECRLMVNDGLKKTAGFKICYSIIYALLNENQQKYFSVQKKNVISAAVEYICSNYHQSITNDYLSKLCGLSESRFRALFREVVGKSPISYRNELRIEKAKEMLRSEYSSITDMAAVLGFRDVYEFSRSFKKHTGCSPSNYAFKGE